MGYEDALRYKGQQVRWVDLRRPPEGKGRGVGLLRNVSMRGVSIAVHDNFAAGTRGSLGVPATIAIPLEFVVIDSIQLRRKDRNVEE
jgi:hypothetical protein